MQYDCYQGRIRKIALADTAPVATTARQLGANMQSYNWQTALQDAVLEINPEKLRVKVHLAEVAIFERAQVLSLLSRGDFGRGNLEEQKAIESAACTLLTLQENSSLFFD